MITLELLKDKVKREKFMLPTLVKGYPRKTASDWYDLVKRERYTAPVEGFDPELTARVHETGYLCRSARDYGMLPEELQASDEVSDFAYTFLKPFNSSFTKWIEDIITARRVLSSHTDVLRNVYFSLVQRDGNVLILSPDGNDRAYTVQDVLQLVRDKGAVELRPSSWKSTRRRHQLCWQDDVLTVNDLEIEPEMLQTLLDSLSSEYIIADPVDLVYRFGPDLEESHGIKFYLANDDGPEPKLLQTVLMLYENKVLFSRNRFTRRTVERRFPIDRKTGTFTCDGEDYTIPDWDAIVAKMLSVARDLPQISYFSVSVALQPENLFQIIWMDGSPILPGIPADPVLKDYLHRKTAEKWEEAHLTLPKRVREYNDILNGKLLKQVGRPGIRPYMQKLWNHAVLDDMLHTKGPTIREKLWCWRRGFFSYRLWQYGINQDNYRNYLSDYDYFWLNRINNVYQKWVNDKTSYRFLMEPFKQYIPAYYFSVYKQRSGVRISRMPDCPRDVSEDIQGVCKLLREKGKLAFKASAGTHGDGFYCLAYENGKYYLNGKESDEQGLADTIYGQKSFYIITEYLVMHRELRAIYPNSVNTVRVMVVNEHGYDPKILQTYMRIGSSSTGFTDNVGYGGICAMIDRETGELYLPQTISAHVFHDCPVHPDTKKEISGALPNWELLRNTVLEIARYFGELEYLGFDVAITDAGICVLEINIHQDLHKVADFSDEIQSFFRRKIAEKRMKNGLKVI